MRWVWPTIARTRTLEWSDLRSFLIPLTLRSPSYQTLTWSSPQSSLLKRTSLPQDSMKHAMELTMQVTEFLNPGQTTVLGADQPLYATSGRAQSTLDEHHITRTRYAHQVSLVALYMLKKSAYVLEVLQWRNGSTWVIEYVEWTITNGAPIQVLVYDNRAGVAHDSLYAVPVRRSLPTICTIMRRTLRLVQRPGPYGPAHTVNPVSRCNFPIIRCILSSMCSAPMITTSLSSPNVSGNCHCISLMIAYSVWSAPRTHVWPGLRISVPCIVSSIACFIESWGKDIRLSKLDWGLDHVRVW